MNGRQLLSWASDLEGAQGANSFGEEIMTHLRGRQKAEEYSFYQNFSRTAPIRERYKGRGRLEKLQALKAKWDPENKMRHYVPIL